MDNFVYEDSDWEEFLDSLGIDLIETVNSTYVFSDENYIMLLDYEEHPNRFDSGLGNDFIVDFSTIKFHLIFAAKRKELNMSKKKHCV